MFASDGHTSLEYVAKLQAERAKAQHNAEVYALALIQPEYATIRKECAEKMHFYSDMRNKLDQQLAWINRRSGLVVPAEPAWCD
jgi:hypothetical protein